MSYGVTWGNGWAKPKTKKRLKVNAKRRNKITDIDRENEIEQKQIEKKMGTRGTRILLLGYASSIG